MKRLLTAALAAAVSLGGLASAQTPEIDIPYESFELENGLTVVVHEDRKAPIVAVSIWYGVGSAEKVSTARGRGRRRCGPTWRSTSSRRGVCTCTHMAQYEQ